ncbi:MAG TPA: winged helix-turn-helix domain-containing protein, partial [Terriglobales bacterium]|nr:winged helix-turn-helix domain-containing protein [Terriglobales bacterium]
MVRPVANPRIIRFGLYEVDLDTRELRKSGFRIKLQGQPFQILAMLLARPGAIVTREELQKDLWPSDTFVDFDLSLNSAVKKLRQALNDDSENPRFVETLYRRGYRFIGPVERPAGIEPIQSLENGTDSTAATTPIAGQAALPESLPAQGTRRTYLTAVVLFAFLALVAIAFLWLRKPLPTPRVLSTVPLTSDNLPKDLVATDGPRVYFVETVNERALLSQVSASGGDISHIPTPFANSFLHAVSPLRSELLVDSGNEEGILGSGQAAAWIVPIPAGSPRRVGDFLVNAATWSRDGQQLAYSQDHDIYLARWDGTQSHKLITIADICGDLQFSPDAKHLRFTASSRNFRFSLWEVGIDGSGLRQLFPGLHQDLGVCCGRWSADGRYYFFVAFHSGRSDIWALREGAGIFRPGSPDPLPLTAGPLAYFSPAPALAGDRLFLIGEQQRAQLERLDAKSQQFVPFLNGISAGETDFSRDGKWVTYVSYPDYLLWRSRSDGSEKLQLTYAPVNVATPRWSPDGRQIAYSCGLPGETPKACIVSADGGVTEELQIGGQYVPDDPQWSPDGKSLILALYPPGLISTKTQNYSVGQLDLQAKKTTTLPGSEGMLAPRWSPDGRYISTFSADGKKAMLLELSTGNWSELAKGTILLYPNWSLDSKYAYFEDLGADGPEIDRVSVATRKKERVTILKGIS